MILTVTPNAARDRTRHVRWLGEHPRGDGPLLQERLQAGGKGVNVARILRELGLRVRALVAVGGRNGDWLVDDLVRAGVSTVAVRAPGETRTCTDVVEAGSGRVRPERGPGIEGSPELADRLLARIERELVGVRWLALCGSLPNGLPAGFAAELVALAERRGVRCAVDTSGPGLVEAWRQGPDLVRVNRTEAAAASGAGGPDRAALDALGPARRVVVSAGPAPFAAWETGGQTLRVTPPPVSLVNPTGCGDAMMAGLLSRLDARDDWSDALRFATALAGAQAESLWAGHPDPGRARALLDRVGMGSDPTGDGP